MYDYKSITDPIYGYVGLSELEADVVSTSTFQRLHNVRQLGLAHLVFPSAGYSRFSHSVGACHTAGKILDGIENNAPTSSVKGKKRQLYRLAALLHDVGHYPFSHATEESVLDFYVGESVLDIVGESDPTGGQTGLHHEEVGRLIIAQDPEISRVLKKHGYKSDDLLTIFSKAKPDLLFGIISSDLDCDRLDYLRRSAHACGVPYGEVDVDFIISKATVDQDGILCFQEKAATAIDHFLVSRFYDYMQVVYHKTVVGLEWSLKESISALLKRGDLNLSSSSIETMLADRTWYTVDDNFLQSEFRKALSTLESSAGTGLICDHLRAVLLRQPAKLVFQWEALLDKDDDRAKLKGRIISDEALKIAKKLSLDPKRFHVIQRKPFPFSTSLPRKAEGISYGEKARSVSVLEKGKRKATLLSDLPNTLISSLFEHRTFSLRVLYLPQNKEDKLIRENIRREFAALGI